MNFTRILKWSIGIGIGSLVLLFVIGSFFGTPSSSKPDAPAVVSQQEEKPSYQIVKTDKQLGGKRVICYAVITGKPSQQQLEEMAKEIVKKNQGDAGEFTAFLNDREEYIGSGASLGKVEVGKSGIAVDVASKDWSKRPNDEDVALWSKWKSYSKLPENSSKSTDEVTAAFAKQSNVSIDTLKSLNLKIAAWLR